MVAKVNPTAYPLSWPEHQRRTNYRSDWPGKPSPTVAEAYAEVVRELDLMPGVNPSKTIVSTNVPVGAKGAPRADLAYKAKPDPGVAVWFERRKKLMCIACDRFNDVAANLRAIAKILDGRRREERYGTEAMVEASWQAFDVAALPARAGAAQAPARPWFEVLGVYPNSSKELAEAAYRVLAKSAHPDAGGSAERMAELNAAIEAARKETR